MKRRDCVTHVEMTAIGTKFEFQRSPLIRIEIKFTRALNMQSLQISNEYNICLSVEQTPSLLVLKSISVRRKFETNCAFRSEEPLKVM